MVKTVSRKVSPYRTVVLAIHDTLLNAAENQILPFKISVGFIIYLVEIHTQSAISLIETGINPTVHHLPQTAHLLIACLPFAEHLASLCHKGGFLLSLLLGDILALHDLLEFSLVVLVESHIEITNQMISLLSGGFRSCILAPLLPGEHGFADMYSTVVDNVGFDNLMTVCLENLRQRITEKVVSDMTQMQRFIGIWRRILHHHKI